jgi:H+/Cl- antiporter ClcA
MIKVLAVVRTIFLIFIIGYTVRAMPFYLTTVSRTFDEQYSRCANSLSLVSRAAWIAIAWIALETALGWLMARRRPAMKDLATPGEPPFAPPPQR